MAGSNQIIVAGVVFDPNRFPSLYKFAQTNPVGLEALLWSLARASGGDQTDFTQDAINLEQDLQRG